MDETMHSAAWSEFLQARPVLYVVGISLLSFSEEVSHSFMIKSIFAAFVIPTWTLGFEQI